MKSNWLILSALGIAFWGLWSFVLKIVLQRGMSIYTVTAVSVVGTTLTAIVALPLVADSATNAIHLAAVLYALLGGALGGLSLLAYIAALERGPTSIIVPLFALSPSITVALSLILLGEHLKPIQMVGVFLALTAALVMGRKEGSI